MDNIVPAGESQPQPENPLTRAIAAAKDGSITVVQCHLCNSKLRQQMEAMYEQRQSIPAIRKFLEDNGEPIPSWRIRHHLENHYRNMEMQAAIAEYRDRLDDMMQRRRNMVSDMEHSIAIAWIELSKAIAIPTGNDVDAALKRTKMVAEIQRTIREGYDFIRSLCDSESKARGIEERFAKVWEMKLQNAKTPEEKSLLVATLQDFKEKFQQVS